MFSKTIISSPWYYFVLCLALSAGISLWLYYKNRKNTEAPAWALRGMAALRFLSLFLISLFLLSIFLKRLSNETEYPLVILAVDNSASVGYASDSVFARNELPLRLETLRKRLEDKFTVKTLLFGGEVTSSGENPSFSEKETDLENLIKEVENNYFNQNVGALILASDGIYNKGGNPIYASEKLGYPIYSIALGDTSEIRDVLIRKVNHNQVAYSGNHFPVEVVVNAKKLSGKEVVVSISEGNTERARQQLRIPSDNFSGTCQFTLTAAGTGVTRYQARVSVLEGETNLSNNVQPFVIEVIDNKEKILLLASRPHPDIAALNEVIGTGTNYELEYSLTEEFNKPLKPYSLVILHGYTPSQAQLLSTCQNNQIPFWIIHPASPDNLPGIRISGSLNRFNDSEPYIDNSFGLFTVSDGLRKLAKDLPAVRTFFGNYSLSNGSSSLINQRIGLVETENPVLFFSEINGLKSAVFLGDGLWKWKFRDFAENKNHQLFTELISKSVQYLSVRSDKSYFRVSAPRIVMENNDIELGAEVYNKSYEAITDPDVSLVLSDEKNRKYNYTFSKTSEAYRLNIGKLPPGEYRYEASVKLNNELFVKQGLFAVREVFSEKISTVADHQLLYQMARRSNGKLFFPAQLDQLEEELLKNENIKPITYSQITTSSLIDLTWLFWIILILLAAEWFFRKRFLSI